MYHTTTQMHMSLYGNSNYTFMPMSNSGMNIYSNMYQENNTPTSRRSTRQVFANTSVPPLTAQAIWSTYSSRLKEKEGNTSLLLSTNNKRRTRGAGANVNYAEDALSDEAEFWGGEEYNKRNMTPVDKNSSGRPYTMREGASEKPVTKRWMRKTKHVYKSNKEMERMAEQKEVLIPIRLDFDFENHKLRDTFTWNLNEKIITPESFAEILCNDLEIPVETYTPLIAEAIRSQVAEYESAAEKSLSRVDYRVEINLDIQVGKLNLRDRFEWDLSSDLTPEEFSRLLTADLGVGGEFAPIIAFSIHEQLLRHKEKLDDFDPESEPLKSAFRPFDEAEEWAPILETLTTEELEKIVLDKERSIRRLRRETSRFGNSRSRQLPRNPNSSILSPNSSPLRRQKNMQPVKPLKQERVRERGQRLAPEQLEKWHCEHCRINGRDTPLVRRGPDGTKTLCNACGLYWINKSSLPPLRKDMFAHQQIH
ncbi:10024_t:CDS:2 [Ambispora leptoticha]|uniref:10024_t:CDS:1 n=1 Tax=Ambispora leptoticha TaxID=144679 RepID=A0A9N9CEF7_9GLOM|nr:10024_t:CDS:2 [Ambispora leptoticha]